MRTNNIGRDDATHTRYTAHVQTFFFGMYQLETRFARIRVWSSLWKLEVIQYRIVHPPQIFQNLPSTKVQVYLVRLGCSEPRKYSENVHLLAKMTH